MASLFDKYRLFRKFSKKVRKLMAKNERKKGRSARNGNAPAPYTKYQKVPYKYTSFVQGYSGASNNQGNAQSRGKKRVYA